MLVLTDESKTPKVWKERAMSPETAALLKDNLVKAVEGLEYGWFVGFDANDPRLLMSVMVEDVGKRGGSKYVTPIVKRVFQYARSNNE